MDSITLEKFASIVEGTTITEFPAQQTFNNISIDSRRISKNSIFFPLKGTQVDGHQFISEALMNGAVASVVSQDWATSFEVNLQDRLITVKDPLEALHRLAGWWREQLSGKVVGVTGSNGKTIVKDALVHLLSEISLCSGSPDSFNSQIGVPLSVIRIPRTAEYVILEAGISGKNEMNRLEQIIRPDYGILTNIGRAHISAFGRREDIAEEKLKLFRNIKQEGWLLIPANDPVAEQAAKQVSCKIYRFGTPSDEIPYIEHREMKTDGMQLVVRFPDGQTIDLLILTPSLEIVSDIEIAIDAAWLLGVKAEVIKESLSRYAPGTTRMEVWKSPAGFTLINDSCSSDPISVKAALNTLASMNQKGGKRIFVFGGMRELGAYAQEEHAQVGTLAAQSQVDTLVLVGQNEIAATEEAFQRTAPESRVIRCRHLEDVKENLLPDLQWGDTVLVKGPRSMAITRVAREIMEAMAPNRFNIDLQSVNENINRFQHLIGQKTKILVMVKALGYGSDPTRLSLALQRMEVDYIGVSSADEGAALRKAGVDLPILVMMCSAEEAEKITRHHLIPMIYSFEIIDSLAREARAQGKILDVHIEIDTGLNRLGVRPESVIKLAKEITETGSLRIIGAMTHFACADDPEKDDFTRLQISRFQKTVASLREIGLSDLICHAGATAGAARFPEAHFDMVRLGIGMYGIYPSEAVKKEIDLELAISLVSRIIEIRTLQKGDRVGYGGTFEVPADNYKVGVVPMGYHDGIPFVLANKGSVLVNGKTAPIIGRISMDSMIIDLSEIPDIQQKADVLIFGKYDSYVVRPEDVANQSETIPYELLTRIGPRVQRIFIGEFN
jgi:alanine racemase